MNTSSKYKLVHWIFMALCCALGMFTKGIILPLSNMVTAMLGTPGGIATAFSLMFLAVGARLCSVPFAGTLMGLVQGFLAIFLGMTGSMGALAFVGYIIPGIIIDICYFLAKRVNIQNLMVIVVPLSNGIASVSAAFFKNSVTYRIGGSLLVLYIFVALVSGIVFGILGVALLKILKPIIRFE